MPNHHVQYNGSARTAEGTLVPAMPQAVLEQLGPLLDVSVTVSQVIGQQLAARGQKSPRPVIGRALIDTGAVMTCISESAATNLGLQPVDVVQMASASHETVDTGIYPISMTIIGTPLVFDVPRAMGAPALDSHGLILLIGRDVLQNCTLFYNGAFGQITLSV